jgi:hypothetical protein
MLPLPPLLLFDLLGSSWRGRRWALRRRRNRERGYLRLMKLLRL